MNKTSKPPSCRVEFFFGILFGILAVLTIASAAAASPAFSADESTDKVDKLFEAWDKTTSPGASLAVVKDGKIIYERGYGMAKLEDGIVNTPEKVFDIGSVSKQFTAACVAMLVREGKIGVDDDIRKYLPEMPAYEKPVTVRHLLHHTSGLRDYCDLLDLAGFRAESDSPTVEEALEIIRRQKKLNSTPGSEYSYTNTGYFLLGQIVERVSGRSLNAFAQDRILKPLGMAKTLFLDDHTRIIKDRATGYTEGEGGFKICMSNWDETGDGSVCTTVRDLFLWDQAFYTGALGKDLMEMLQTTGVLNSGKAIDYAWGLRVGEYKGLRVVRHGGSWAGFRAALVRFPEQKFSVIILANLDSIDPSGLAFKVADIYLAGLLKEPATGEGKNEGQAEAAGAGVAAKGGPGQPTPEMAAAPKAELQTYAGAYTSEELLDAKYLLSVDKGTLVLKTRAIPRAELKATSPDKFVAPDYGLNLEFVRGKGGKMTGFKLNVEGATGIAFSKDVR